MSEKRLLDGDNVEIRAYEESNGTGRANKKT